MSDHPDERLSDYLDGGLATAERVAVESHLTGCAECAVKLEALRDVVAQARALPHRPPEADLWPAIAARLRPRPERSPATPRSHAGWWRRRVAFSVPQLAAAAAAVLLLSAGAVWLVLERGRAPLGIQAPGGSATATPATAAAYDETRYDTAVAELERVLHQHRGELDPATVRILEQNLAIIDRATVQARRALLADPANPYLNGHLAEQLRRKIRLLQRANDFVTAHS